MLNIHIGYGGCGMGYGMMEMEPMMFYLPKLDPPSHNITKSLKSERKGGKKFNHHSNKKRRR